MSELKFNKAADEEHEVQLDSHLISATWLEGAAWAGCEAPFQIRTVFVGDGAKIKVTGKSEKGKKLGKVSGEIHGNLFCGKFDIPAKIEPGDEAFFAVELPNNSLDGESERIPILPEALIKSMKWSAAEARRGDTLTLSAELEGVADGKDVLIIIYEYDADGCHDRITELSGTIKGGKLEEKWDYEYHEDTDELPTKEEVEKCGGAYNPPEYFFTIKIDGFELGKPERDSGLLTFKDHLELKVLDKDGSPLAGVGYKVYLPDDKERSGTLDDDGYAREEGVPPGKCRVELEQKD